MGDEPTEELVALVRRVRAAMEEARLPYIGFDEFPGGSCLDASYVLGEVLAAEGFGTWTVRSGERHRPSHFTHAWLRNGAVVLDITGDQFDGEGRLPVYVGTEGEWFAAFDPHDEGPALISRRAELGPAYLELRHRLAKSVTPPA